MTPSAPATPDDLFALLDRLGVAYVTHPHRPIYTVAEGEDLKRALPGGHSKNLFLKDKKGRIVLLSALGDTKIDINAFSRAIGAARFSFANAELMQEVLGVTPGSVTAFALINAAPGRLDFFLDEALLAHDPVNFHPLHNAATTAVSPAGLFRFLEATGHRARRAAFGPDGAVRSVSD